MNEISEMKSGRYNRLLADIQEYPAKSQSILIAELLCNEEAARAFKLLVDDFRRELNFKSNLSPKEIAAAAKQGIHLDLFFIEIRRMPIRDQALLVMRLLGKSEVCDAIIRIDKEKENKD